MRSKHAEYAHYLNKKGAYIVPPSVEIDMTNACNQDCTYCNVVEFRNANNDMTKIHDYHVLVERVKSWQAYVKGAVGNVNTITFVGGGEPTARKGYEYVVEQAVDTELLVSIITNGSGLDRLHNLAEDSVRKISWIGVDIDSGIPEIYEQVRRSKQKGLFEKVKANIRDLTSIGVNIDIKGLLLKETASFESVESMFQYCKDVGGRMVYLRLAQLDNGGIFGVSDEYVANVKKLAVKMGVPVRINTTRMIERNYTRCHALHLIPIFSADGHIYTCCESRGNPTFDLGNWLADDFRDLWMSEKHQKMYRDVDVSICPSCRPNVHNIEIENLITTDAISDNLFF